MRRRFGISCVAVGAASLLGAVIPTSIAGATAPTSNACNGTFSGNPGGSLSKATVPANGATVVAGQTVTVTITWDVEDWAGATLDQIHDCVQVNEEDVVALNAEEKPTANDGTWVTSYTIPADVSPGDEVCDRSSLSGQPSAQNPSTQKSNVVCFTVGNPPTTTTAGPTTTTAAPTTTTTAAPTTTTTEAPTTTTTLAPTTTTTVAPTTTTTEGSTTTTTAAQETTTTVAAPTTTTAPLPTTTVTVLGTTVTQNPTPTTAAAEVLGEQLARTGSDIKSLIMLASLALLLGGLAVIAGARDDQKEPARGE